MGCTISRDNYRMKISMYQNKFIRNIRDYGLHVTFVKILNFVIRPIYVKTVFRIYSINTEVYRTLPHGNENMHLRLLTAEDVGMIKQIEASAEWLRGQLQAKLAQGGICMVATTGEDVVAFNLVSLRQTFVPLANLDWVPDGKEAWSEHIATHKNWRRRRLALKLRRRILYELNLRGIERLFGGTLRSNLPSLKLARKIGFKELGDLYYTKYFVYRCWRYDKLTDESAVRHPRFVQSGVGVFYK